MKKVSNVTPEKPKSTSKTKKPKQPQFDQPILISLTPSEISKSVFSECSTFTTSFKKWSWDKFATDTIEVVNGSNSCRLVYTESISSYEEDTNEPISAEDCNRDIFIELKLGDAYLIAIYEITVSDGLAEYEYYKNIAETEFIKAATLIGCPVKYKPVPV